MSQGGDIDVEINRVLWSIGWKARELFGALAIISLFILVTDYPRWIAGAVFVSSIVIPLTGLIYVWMKLKYVHDTAIEQIQDSVESLIEFDDGGVERFSLVNNAAFGMLLPPHEFYATTLVADDSRLIVNDESIVELPRLTWQIEESVSEYPFDRVTNLDYTPTEDFTQLGDFSITLYGGDTDVYHFSRAPDDAFETIQRRFRTHSTQ